jgi:1-acyl-sn-glycerol-3-phosphate acyltransferase
MYYNFFKLIARIVIFFKFKLEIIGMHNIPKNGPFIVASNHTSNYDPILLIGILTKEIHFLAKQELFKYRITRWFFENLNVIPVDRQSGIVIRPVRRSLNVIKEGNVYGIFPEGTRCRNGKKVNPKKGVGFMACQTGSPILPVAIVGVGKGLRLPVKVIIGPLLEVNNLNVADYAYISEMVMEKIYKIKNQYVQLEKEQKEGFNTEFPHMKNDQTDYVETERG